MPRRIAFENARQLCNMELFGWASFTVNTKKGAARVLRLSAATSLRTVQVLQGKYLHDRRECWDEDD